MLGCGLPLSLARQPPNQEGGDLAGLMESFTPFYFKSYFLHVWIMRNICLTNSYISLLEVNLDFCNKIFRLLEKKNYWAIFSLSPSWIFCAVSILIFIPPTSTTPKKKSLISIVYKMLPRYSLFLISAKIISHHEPKQGLSKHNYVSSFLFKAI